MQRKLDLRIGIDVGGTNTDAVVFDADDNLLAKAKCPTSQNLTSGIEAAMNAVLADLGAERDRVTHVMLGTTHATNAILERRELMKVAVVRIGAPATLSIPPLIDWPADLRDEISVGEVIIGGGSELTGERLAPFGAEELRSFLLSVKEQTEAVAVTSVYSPVSNHDELQAQDIVREVLGDEIPVSLSHGIGALGLLERESACVLNASLFGVATRVVDGLSAALKRNGVDAVSFIAQNDGTLMGLDYVRRFPVLTIGSGPANSMRGAAFLSGVKDALVVDVGGTSTDIGVLINGYPRTSSAPVDVGGVRTNFRMPDLVSIAIGGGTIVEGAIGDLRVGPASVGYKLSDSALCFGGSVTTMTDAAVAIGRAKVGDLPMELHQDERLASAVGIADAAIADAIDQVKTSGRELVMLAVGGGSIIIADSIDGVSEIIRPEHFDVANAIGAAIASVSGTADRVFKLEGRTREDVLAEASQAALDEAIAAGADPNETKIIELEEVPMAYVTEPIIRIRAKAAGPLGAI